MAEITWIQQPEPGWTGSWEEYRQEAERLTKLIAERVDAPAPVTPEAKELATIKRQLRKILNVRPFRR